MLSLFLLMELKLFWAILSSVLTVVLFVPYLRDIFLRKTQPHMYSWLIWGLLQVIGASAIFKGGAGLGTWSLVVGGIVCLSIFGLSFKYGTKNIKRFDVYCLVGALIALLAYLFVSNPLYSVILVATIDFIAYFPTLRKGYEEPYSETLITFEISAFVNIISIFALQHYSVTTVLYEVTLSLTNVALCIILITRRKVVAKKI